MLPTPQEQFSVVRRGNTVRRGDDELYRALGAEDPSAMAPIYDRYSSLVFGLASSILASADEAEDLTQEVFIALYRRRAFDPARGTLGAYLVTLTRSRALDRLRSRRRLDGLLEVVGRQMPEPVESTGSLEQLALDESASRVRDAMEALPHAQRRVLELAYYDGLSQSEIAVSTGVPLGTVKSWSRRALLSLRERLRDLVE
ncbi:MAG: sigma-70 family RNA polymerase sigma factor [bacterium]